MSSAYFLAPTLAAIVISMLIVRAGAIALMMTGMNYEKAKFQALSAFTGTGFTTREAERVVNNMRRRKIVSLLMILGNIGIVAVIVTTTSSFAKANGLEVGVNAVVLLFGAALILIMGRYAPLVSRWESFAHTRLAQLKIFDDDTPVDELLHIAEGYGVVRIQLIKGSPFIGRALSEVSADLENSMILGIEHDRDWFPMPSPTRRLIEDDLLVIYGDLEDMTERFDEWPMDSPRVGARIVQQ